MGGDRTLLATAIACRASSPMEDAADCRSDPVSAARWPAVADAAALLPAGVDRQALVLHVARQRVVANAEPFPADGHARDSWP